jgi:hypothetical protein
MWIGPTLDELKNSPTGFVLREQVRPSVGGIQVIKELMICPAMF